jgi:hypothetical protein
MRQQVPVLMNRAVHQRRLHGFGISWGPRGLEAGGGLAAFHLSGQ